MTNEGMSTPPGYYRASDGRDYPVPEGHVLGTDGQLHPLPAPPPAAPPPPPPGPPPPASTTGATWAPPSGPSYAASAAPPPAGPPAAASKWRWDVASILLLTGAAAVVVGAFLPWVTWGSFSKAGTEGDGSITLVLAVATAALGTFGLMKASRKMTIGAIVAAALVVLIAVIDMVDVGSEVVFGVTFEIGIGLYMTLVGGIGALVGAALGLRSRPTAP